MVIYSPNKSVVEVYMNVTIKLWQDMTDKELMVVSQVIQRS